MYRVKIGCENFSTPLLGQFVESLCGCIRECSADSDHGLKGLCRIDHDRGKVLIRLGQFVKRNGPRVGQAIRSVSGGQNDAGRFGCLTGVRRGSLCIRDGAGARSGELGIEEPADGHENHNREKLAFHCRIQV